MNNYIRKLKLTNIKSLYLDVTEIKHTSKKAMIAFASNNQQIELLIYTYDCYANIINDMKFDNLKYLYIKKNNRKNTLSRFADDYAYLINFYSKTLKYLNIDCVSICTSESIKNCSELRVLNLSMYTNMLKERYNNLNIIKNVRCQDLVINKLYRNCGIVNIIKLKYYISEIINTIIENDFLRKVIIKETNFNFIF